MNQEIKVYDDFLSKEDHDRLVHLFSGLGEYSKFPWECVDNDRPNLIKFTHDFWSHGPMGNYSEWIGPLTYALDIKSLVFAFASLYPKGSELVEFDYHVDIDFACTTCVYYVNTCDGYTKFEDCGTVVDSVANRCLVFPSQLRHTGTNVTDTNKRLIINMNFFN
tara:strand:- start:547 stop:1038 length:492 start_codon:yes stop_codon:yes gene_type:complete